MGVEPSSLKVALVLSSSEMVKVVVENGIGAAAIPESMVRKELQLDTLIALSNYTDGNVISYFIFSSCFYSLACRFQARIYIGRPE